MYHCMESQKQTMYIWYHRSPQSKEHAHSQNEWLHLYGHSNIKSGSNRDICTHYYEAKKVLCDTAALGLFS